jgi:hypothetical protein
MAEEEKGGLPVVADRSPSSFSTSKVERIGQKHQAGSDSLLTAQVFFKVRLCTQWLRSLASWPLYLIIHLLISFAHFVFILWQVVEVNLNGLQNLDKDKFNNELFGYGNNTVYRPGKFVTNGATTYNSNGNGNGTGVQPPIAGLEESGLC